MYADGRNLPPGSGDSALRGCRQPTLRERDHGCYDPGTNRLGTNARRCGTVLAAAAFALPAHAQGTVKSVHGDWQVRCDTPPGAQGEQCALIQSVTAEDRPNVGLTVIVLKTADQKSRLMRVLAPLGVLLPSGPRPEDRQDRRRPRRVRALPAERLRRRGVMDDNLVSSCAPDSPRPSSSSRRRKKASASR